MGILDRLGDVIKSYVYADSGEAGGRSFGGWFSGDSDLDAAFDELNEFLAGEPQTGGGQRTGGKPQDRAREHSFERQPGQEARSGGPPETLRRDFAELGLGFGAGAEECKAAYKKLLKIHHPDRHAGNENNLRKATEKSARINAAWDRINKWYETGAS